MREVAIMGAGMTPCRSRWIEKTFWELAQMAVSEAVRDAGFNFLDMDVGVTHRLTHCHLRQFPKGLFNPPRPAGSHPRTNNGYFSHLYRPFDLMIPPKGGTACSLFGLCKGIMRRS